MRFTCQRAFRSILFDVLNALSEYYPDLEPLRTDSDDNLLEKYFYWVDEYNDGYDPRNFIRPEWIGE